MHIIAAKEEYKKRGKGRRGCDKIVIPVLATKDTVGKNDRHEFFTRLSSLEIDPDA